MPRLRVREVAQAQGLDMAKLSRRSDLAYRTIQKLWNNPDYDVSIKTLGKIADALHVEVKDLIASEKGDQQDNQTL